MATTPETASGVLVPVADPLFTAAGAGRVPGRLLGADPGCLHAGSAADTSWCATHGPHLFDAKRAEIECFRADMESRGRARSTIARRLCTISGFYRYAVEEELLDHSPAAHVRRPRLDYESHATALDRNELGALLVAAGLGPAHQHR